MAHPLQAPFFVIEDNDVMFCRSLEELERFVEPIDAPDAKAYDATGMVVRLRVVPRVAQSRNWITKWLSARLVIQAVPTESRDPEALERALKTFLSSVDPTVGQLSLAQIVKNLDRYGVYYS